MTWGVAILIIIAITLIERMATSSRAQRAAIDEEQAYDDGYSSALPAGDCDEDGHAWADHGGPEGEFCRICYLPRSEADEDDG